MDQLVQLTKDNMNEFSSQEALSKTRKNLSMHATRIITLTGKNGDLKNQVVGFAGYQLNCNEDDRPVAYLYELQLAVDVRGGAAASGVKKPSLGKAL